MPTPAGPSTRTRHRTGIVQHGSPRGWPLVVLAAAALAAAEPASADPAQGAVLGGAAGAVIGGGQGAAIGALLGGAGGAKAEGERHADKARWEQYYRQQQAGQAGPPIAAEPTDSAVSEHLPTGSGLIKAIQRSLTVLGYRNGPVDGLTDGATMDAIRDYQEDHDLPTTGRPSRDLLIHLRQNGG